ncbi:hypothetical protein [Microbulbifer sediminum]|uniref:hypothetical protein n=1 Tax=Microbulbifer sediminum TaxID=2904250 RepID=UPI001F42B4EC|nr:hypothetical protein [Microbulbifer sediminum]
MRTLYLHIGFHKTGSSSLQLALHRHRAPLLDAGVEFVALGKKGNSSGAIEVEAREEGLEFHLNDRFRQLLASSRGDTVIVSAEHLSFLYRGADIRQVRDICAELFDRTVVIAYLRRQDLHARSFKQQGARGCERGRSSSSKLLGHDEGALPPLNAPVRTYYDYFAKLQQWEACFGEEALEVREFEPGRLCGGDIVTDFMGLVSNGAEIPPLRVNEGVGRREFLLTHKLIELGVAPDDIRRLKPGMRGDDSRVAPARDNARAFFLAFSESNRQLNDHYLRHASGLAFSDDFSSYPEVGNDHLSCADLAQWSADLFAAGLQNPQGLRDALLADCLRSLAGTPGLATRVIGELYGAMECLAHTARIAPARNPWWRRLKRKKHSGR